MYKIIHNVEAIDGDDKERNSNISEKNNIPADWCCPGWLTFAVFCNYNVKPDIELSCLMNSNPSDKKQLSRAAQRKKAIDKKKKKREVTVVSEKKN
eukprot:6783594-Ditylum_brightwellii.AAC.1